MAISSTTAVVAGGKSTRFVARVIAPLSFALILLVIVEAALPQFEMLLTGGSIPIPTSSVKFILLALLLLAYALRREGAQEWIPLGPWFLFVGFLVLDVPHLLSQDSDWFHVAGAYYGYYSFVLLLPLVGFISGYLQENLVVLVLNRVFWICASIGLAQYVFNSPILYTESSDGHFAILNVDFFASGAVRAFSLFAHSLGFGLFCVFIGCIGLDSYLGARNRKWNLLLFVAAAGCCYATLTRAVFIVFITSILAVFAMRFSQSMKLLNLVSVVSFLVGLGVLYGGALELLGGTEGLADNLSLLERLHEWAFYWITFADSSTFQKLFGLGIVQDANVNQSATYPIDNLFLALVLHIGIIGAVLFLFLCWSLWSRICKRTLSAPSPLRVGVCALWASLPVLSLFGISATIFPAVVMLLIMTGRRLPDEGTQLRIMRNDSPPLATRSSEA